MKIELSKSTSGSFSGNSGGNLNDEKSSTFVVFATTAKQGKTETAKVLHADLQKRLSDAISDGVITGKVQESAFFRNMSFAGAKHVLVIGLGPKIEAEIVRQAGAITYNALKAEKVIAAQVHFDNLLGGKKEISNLIQAYTEGLLLADYKFDELKSNKKEKETKKSELRVSLVCAQASEDLVKKAFHEAQTLGECVNFSRRLGDLPGNLMTPTILADTVTQAIRGTGVKAEVWDKVRIKKEKMGGLYGVSQGSHQDPRFIILKYEGAAKSKKPIVFVGKGLTFDSGGISIKPSAAMEEMKYDMCGGANVIGTLLAIAKLKLKVNAIALIPSTENMPGGSATKPGDIHTARNGKTFEVNNTDAEGRLILSDALSYGTELEPLMMVDAATLTGAMVVALGNTHTGFFTRNEELNKKIQHAADKSGEWVWRMPLCDFHTKDMKGTFADLSNISSSKGAGSATAAAFLEQFVGEGIPWAHFDIAGTGWAIGGRLPYCTKKGASGVMIRTFVELAKTFQ